MEGYPVVSYLLQQTLRCLCTDSDWVYAVFWRILPRNYPPPKWDSDSAGVLDRSKGNKRNWILVWEDGFCDFVACADKAAAVAMAESTSSIENTDNTLLKHQAVQTRASHSMDRPASPAAQFMQPELFFKMSHEVYNFGEGVMGKVAADNSHKWVYKEAAEEADSPYPAASPWQGALDPFPRTWEAQFKSSIETIAIVAVKEGVLQLGSLMKTPEDLNLVLSLQRKFNYLQSIPGVYAVHPMLMQHHGATSSCKRQLDASDVAESSDHFFHQHLPAISSADYGWSPRQQVYVQQNYGSQLHEINKMAPQLLSAYNNNSNNAVAIPHQLPAGSAGGGCATNQCVTTQLDVMQASLQALLSRLPAVTAPPPSAASSASTSPRGHPYTRIAAQQLGGAAATFLPSPHFVYSSSVSAAAHDPNAGTLLLSSPSSTATPHPLYLSQPPPEPADSNPSGLKRL